MRLSTEAVQTLQAAGRTPADWTRQHFPGAGAWAGDACGCPDDRCRGHHHGADQECGCLAALLA